MFVTVGGSQTLRRTFYNFNAVTPFQSGLFAPLDHPIVNVSPSFKEHIRKLSLTRVISRFSAT